MLSLISAGATAQTFNYNSTAPPTWLSVHAHVTALQRPQALSLVGTIVESVKAEPDTDNPWYIWDIATNLSYNTLETRETFTSCAAVQNHLAIIGANFGQLVGGVIGAPAPCPTVQLAPALRSEGNVECCSGGVALTHNLPCPHQAASTRSRSTARRRRSTASGLARRAGCRRCPPPRSS